MTGDISSSDIIASAALLASIYSIYKSLQFNKRQEKFIETNDKLNKLLLEKEKEAKGEANKADIGASFVNTGKNRTKLKVFNKGKCQARNVRIEILESEEIFSVTDINDFFPIETLEQYQSVEIHAHTYIGSPRKAKIKLMWEDNDSADNERTVAPVINS